MGLLLPIKGQRPTDNILNRIPDDGVITHRVDGTLIYLDPIAIEANGRAA